MVSATLEVVTQAALGALVNERGEVPVGRLLRDVASATGAASTKSVEEMLLRMRKDGAVDWAGEAGSLAGVRVLRVLPRRAPKALDGELPLRDEGTKS